MTTIHDVIALENRLMDAARDLPWCENPLAETEGRARAKRLIEMHNALEGVRFSERPLEDLPALMAEAEVLLVSAAAFMGQIKEVA